MQRFENGLQGLPRRSPAAGFDRGHERWWSRGGRQEHAFAPQQSGSHLDLPDVSGGAVRHVQLRHTAAERDRPGDAERGDGLGHQRRRPPVARGVAAGAAQRGHRAAQHGGGRKRSNNLRVAHAEPAVKPYQRQSGQHTRKREGDRGTHDRARGAVAPRFDVGERLARRIADISGAARDD